MRKTMRPSGIMATSQVRSFSSSVGGINGLMEGRTSICETKVNSLLLKPKNTMALTELKLLLTSHIKSRFWLKTRMRWFLESATIMRPSSSQHRPEGRLNSWKPEPSCPFTERICHKHKTLLASIDSLQIKSNLHHLCLDQSGRGSGCQSQTLWCCP